MEKDIYFDCNINGSVTDFTDLDIKSNLVSNSIMNSFNDIISDIMSIKNCTSITIHVVVETK